MGLRERLKQGGTTGPGGTPVYGVATNYGGLSPEIYHELKGELHQRLIDKLDLTTIEKLPREQLREELRFILGSILAGTDLPLNRTEREQMVEELLDEVTGLGPLEPLLRDDTIADI